MGVKAIVSWLNHHGFRNANGNPFYTSAVHAILTREAYSGIHYYNCRDSRTRRERPKSEWVAVRVPEIIPAKEFNLVQERLRSRRPRVTQPRITNSDVLLTGLLRCESCGGKMMLRTGTGKSGGRYRYYTCASHQIKGGSGCHRPVSIPESELDRLVVGALADRLLAPDRLTTLLREAIKHRRIVASGTAARRSALRTDLKSMETQIDRLLSAVADGTLPDASVLRKKMDDFNGRRDECLNLLRTLDSELPESRQALSKQQAVGIASTLKRRLMEAPRPLQKRYVHGLVSEIVGLPGQESG
jgi:site-specific DNA recombinase